MILDLENFVTRERPLWDELSRQLDYLEAEPAWKLDLEQARRLHYLYQRASAALAQISTFSSGIELRQYLESLVARAYAAINAVDRPRRALRPLHWFFHTFPRTFRLHVRAFALSVAAMLAGTIFGGVAVTFDTQAKEAIIPFEGLHGRPSERVRQEEAGRHGHSAQGASPFASLLMSHNIRVSIFTLAMGMTWGIGTLVSLFYNGAVLGVVAVDYVMDGQAPFLLGWLLPHGAIEIPAVLIAGQAGLVLASALIGRGQPLPLRQRMRQALPTLVTLILGTAVLLVWAGFVEAFFSQVHEPVVPYWLKMLFGCVELSLLTLFLGLSGRRDEQDPAAT